MNGPEPIGSVKAWLAGVAAIRSGITNRAEAVGRASASVTSAKGRFSLMVNVLSSTASMLAVAAASARPTTSRCAQRFTEATASAARTGVPSWKASPSRSVKE
jgi:hypothetical protein